jgi:hypothetical protein
MKIISFELGMAFHGLARADVVLLCGAQRGKLFISLLFYLFVCMWVDDAQESPQNTNSIMIVTI